MLQVDMQAALRAESLVGCDIRLALQIKIFATAVIPATAV
jgi:hypothetical protein